jgi:hypothetical protein
MSPVDDSGGILVDMPSDDDDDDDDLDIVIRRRVVTDSVVVVTTGFDTAGSKPSCCCGRPKPAATPRDRHAARPISNANAVVATMTHNVQQLQRGSDEECDNVQQKGSEEKCDLVMIGCTAYVIPGYWETRLNEATCDLVVTGCTAYVIPGYSETRLNRTKLGKSISKPLPKWV